VTRSERQIQVPWLHPCRDPLASGDPSGGEWHNVERPVAIACNRRPYLLRVAVQAGEGGKGCPRSS
jgi:hypothetical protein